MIISLSKTSNLLFCLRLCLFYEFCVLLLISLLRLRLSLCLSLSLSFESELASAIAPTLRLHILYKYTTYSVCKALRIHVYLLHCDSNKFYSTNNIFDLFGDGIARIQDLYLANNDLTQWSE